MNLKALLRFVLCSFNNWVSCFIIDFFSLSLNVFTFVIFIAHLKIFSFFPRPMKLNLQGNPLLEELHLSWIIWQSHLYLRILVLSQKSKWLIGSSQKMNCSLSPIHILMSMVALNSTSSSWYPLHNFMPLVILFFNPEMLVVEELYNEAVVNTARKLIIFNGELDRIRSGCILCLSILINGGLYWVSHRFRSGLKFQNDHLLYHC